MKYWKAEHTGYPITYGIADTKESFSFSTNTYGLGWVITEITKEQYELVQWQKEIQAKADKGQEVQNAIELNATFREYIRELIDDTDFLIKGNLKDMILRPTEPIHQQKYEEHIKLYKAYQNILKSIIKFERGIAITTNIDPKHPVSVPGMQDMVNVFAKIKADEPELWKDITKMLKVEESYEPKSAVDTWIAVEQAANPHIVMQPTTDTGTQIVDAVVSGGT